MDVDIKGIREVLRFLCGGGGCERGVQSADDSADYFWGGVGPENYSREIGGQDAVVETVGVVYGEE